MKDKFVPLDKDKIKENLIGLDCDFVEAAEILRMSIAMLEKEKGPTFIHKLAVEPISRFYNNPCLETAIEIVVLMPEFISLFILAKRMQDI